MIKKYALKAGLEKVTPMTLRHTFSKRIADPNLIIAFTGRHQLSAVQYQAQNRKFGLNDLKQAVSKLTSI